MTKMFSQTLFQQDIIGRKQFAQYISAGAKLLLLTYKIQLKAMTKRYIQTLTILVVLLIYSQCSLRFQDDDMLKQHHHQSYSSEGPAITVHLIPHSHDDVGWLKTVDNYFYGGDMRTQFAGVQYTIDTVVSELSDHPQYKFSIVEMAFLYRWWNQATDKQKQQMKALVANGQIDFINGGWCMSDQANMYYEDFIDNMAVGLRWLKETLNYVPTIAWHIDPFGHHSSAASLFSQMGFNAFFFARIDYQDKNIRLSNKSMEMIWKPYQYSGDKNTYMFTHVNYYFYGPPPGFCFDVTCQDEPIKDDPTLEDYNVDAKSSEFVEYFKSMANHYRTTNLMHTMGSDFHYSNSRMWFKNMDKLLNYINSRPDFGVKFVYSTPKVYIDAIQKEKASYPVKTDDFFPYADNDHAFWTGYFTSRVSLKGFVKDFSRFTQAARKHISELKISNSSNTVRNNPKLIEESIFELQMALGILQHHDAVAGTAKQKVTDDYFALSTRAISKFNNLYRDIKVEQIKSQIGETVSSKDIYFNIFWNETGVETGLSDKLKAGKTVLINFYNPGAAGSYIIRLKIYPKELNIVSISNATIPGDLICANAKDLSDCELIFTLNFEQSSNSYVKLVPSSGGSVKPQSLKELTITQQIHQFKLGNDKVKITRGNQTFELTINGVVQSFKIGYNYYEGWHDGGQNSGAYIFRPINDSSKVYSDIKKIYYCDATGTAAIVLEGDKTNTRVYFSKTVDYVRNYGFLIETFIDSIPISDNKGKEVTLNFQTKYANSNTFYTDSMGLEEQTRILNYRQSWKYEVNEPTAGNYYPINSFIKMKNSNNNRTVTILTDRSQGGSVINQGQIEIMIHRRLLHDDARGVGEPLNQKDRDGQGLRQLVRHYVVFGDQYRQVQKWIDQRIQPAFILSTTNTFSLKAIRPAPVSVPNEVKLYLRPFQDGSYLLRLHNTNPLSKTSIKLGDEWKIVEYTLAANQLVDDWKRNQYKWNEEPKTVQVKPRFQMSLIDKITTFFADKNVIGGKAMNYRAHLSDQASTIDLLPFQMKAFKITKA